MPHLSDLPDGATLVLVGLMGAGKSTVGRRLARVMQREFRDADDEIAIAAGLSIPDIFKSYGEEMFRDLEQRVILRMLKEGKPLVIATGGGAWMNPKVRESVKGGATSIWLKADLDILLERVSKRNTRPLLMNGDKRTTLSRLMAERYPVYETADFTIDSDDGEHENVVGAILQAIGARLDAASKPV